MTDTARNIDRLLEKLPPESLAYDFVSRLRKSEPDCWPEVLKDVLESLINEKIEEFSHAADQAP